MLQKLLSRWCVTRLLLTPTYTPYKCHQPNNLIDCTFDKMQNTVILVKIVLNDVMLCILLLLVTWPAGPGWWGAWRRWSRRSWRRPAEAPGPRQSPARSRDKTPGYSGPGDKGLTLRGITNLMRLITLVIKPWKTWAWNIDVDLSLSTLNSLIKAYFKMCTQY